VPSRIFAVIDVWDALRSDRPYRAAWDEESIIDYLKAERGRHFDPAIVDLFLEKILPSAVS
jgi:response regulator RpfG family c-di-GMP phosphodiesterase